MLILHGSANQGLSIVNLLSTVKTYENRLNTGSFIVNSKNLGKEVDKSYEIVYKHKNN